MRKRLPRTLDMLDVGTRLPAEYVRAVDVIAEADCTTRSRIVRRAVRDFLAVACTEGEALRLVAGSGD